MRAFYMATAALILLTSCSIFRKNQKTEYQQKDSTNLQVSDTLSYSKKDSSGTTEHAATTWWKKDSGAMDESMVITETIKTEKFDTAGRKTEQTITKRKTEAKKQQTATNEQHQQSVSGVEHAAISNEKVEAGSNQQLTKTDSGTFIQTESKSRCSLSLVNIIILFACAAFIWWAWRKWKAFNSVI